MAAETLSEKSAESAVDAVADAADRLKVIGGCLCGAVKVSASGPSICAQYCHCTQCRKAHGAPFVVWTGYKKAEFSVAAGPASDGVRWRAVSESCRRGWCGSCGSPMFMEYAVSDADLWPDVAWVAMGALDEPDRKPSCHIYVSDAPDWDESWTAHKLPRFGGPDGLREILPDGSYGRRWAPDLFASERSSRVSSSVEIS